MLVLIIIGIGALTTQKTWVPKLVEWILANENTPLPIIVENTIPKTESMSGCYVAHLAKDVYTLNIESENTGEVKGMLAFNNYEKDSSAGSFEGTYVNGILSGYYYFTSEGMNSASQVMFKKVPNGFLRGVGEVMAQGDTAVFENPEIVTYDSSYTFVKNEDCIEKFTEVNNKFTFEYNPIFKAFERDQTANLPDTDWRQNTKEKGMLLAHVSIPKAYLPGTNFSDAVLTIGASTDPKAIKSCSLNAGNGEVADGTKTISGYPFSKFVSNDAGAGNFYETVSYRGLLDGDCYAIEYRVHSTNISNYSPEQNIKEFDKAKIQNELEKIINSFRFLVNSD